MASTSATRHPASLTAEPLSCPFSRASGLKPPAQGIRISAGERARLEGEAG